MLTAQHKVKLMTLLRQLVHEVHRRSLWQVVSIYMVGGWLALQAVDTLTGALQLPAWFPSFALVLLIIGFPIVVATAFVQEGMGGVAGPPPSPRDLEAMAPGAAPDPAALHSLFRWRNAILGGLAAGSLWGVVATAWLVFGRPSTAASEAGPSQRQSIAVLPLDNMSADSGDQYFVDGIHEEIITQLSKIGSLEVISRRSVMEYRETLENLPSVAQALGVGFILEGSVRRFEDRVRISTQLIDARTDQNVWVETYERGWEDLFAIQEEVAQEITRALDARLSGEERDRLARRPTESLVAYEFYLRGREYESRSRGLPDLEGALEMYGRAVDVDPEFALAHVRMGTVHERLFWFGFDRTPGRLDQARNAVARAFRLDPDLPEAHLAMAGIHAHGERDYERALQQLLLAESELGNTSEFLMLRGAIQRRQGNMEEAAGSFAGALNLDPRSGGLAMDLANTYAAMGRHEEADEAFELAISIEPQRGATYGWRAWNRLLADGDVAAARRILVEGERRSLIPAWRARVADWYRLEQLAGNSAGALEWATGAETLWIELHYGRLPRSLLVGEALWRMGERQPAGANFAGARDLLKAELHRSPDDPSVHRYLAWTLARLGERTEALRHANRSVELMPPAVDALIAPDFVRDLAAVCVMVGDVDQAIEELERLVAVPNRAISAPLLRLDPIWEPLRDRPRFRRLIGEG
jgi:TolB-like protein/Flp pilus assembly protein TadD